jgi:NTP pyrophosphatase (non-canonical NTP hydrolase)
MDIENISQRLTKFAEDRAWGQFHSPKNLAISLAVEAGELLEIFQWFPETHQYDETIRQKASEEIADILIYAIMFSQKMNIDIADAVLRKIKLNELKYPQEKSKGSNKKYTEF